MECTDCVAARVDYKSGRLALIVSVHCTATCDLTLTVSDFGTFIGTSVAGHAPSLSAGSCYVCSGIDKCCSVLLRAEVVEFSVCDVSLFKGF